MQFKGFEIIRILRIFLVLSISLNDLYENPCMNKQRDIASENSISLKLKKNPSYLKIYA